MRVRFDYARRAAATVLGFVLFGLVGILFKIILLPYTLTHKKTDVSRQIRARHLVSGIWRFFLRYLVWSGVLQFELHGFDRLGRPGQLVLANHPSLLDVLFLLGYIPEINCIVKGSLIRNPVMRSPILACGFIVNDESEAVLETVHTVLQEGQCLLVFPEGTRTGWDGDIRFHRGAVSMGLRSAQLITPVVIRQNPPNFKKGQPWYRIPKVRICYELLAGEDIWPMEWLAGKPLPIAARKLNAFLQDFFNEETRK